jgi:hypothetical protein
MFAQYFVAAVSFPNVKTRGRITPHVVEWEIPEAVH